MITRTLLKEKANRRRKWLVFIRYLLIALSISAFGWLVIDSVNRPNEIVISDSKYDCQAKGCDFSYTVENKSDQPVKGFRRITVFKSSNVSGINSDEILSSERLEFQLKANEKKLVDGFYVTRIEADKLAIDVGQINEAQ
jgi:hypothetical protein